MKIKLIKFKDNLILPKRAHYNDAGIDCFAQEDVTLDCVTIDRQNHNYDYYNLEDWYYTRLNTKMITLGFGLEISDGYMATIRPRSSMNAKGIITQIGTIDSGYRGEIKVVLINTTSKPIEFKKGDKICQIVIEPVILADFVESIDEQPRDTGGFGSTGK